MPCAVSPFYSFNPREYPTRTVWQNPQNQLARQFFCYAYLQFCLRVLWLKHQHMRVKKYMTGCDRHVSCPYPRNRRAANRPGALPEHGGAGRKRTAAAGSGKKCLSGRSAPRRRKKQTGVCAIPFGGCQRRERRPWQCQPHLRRRAPSSGSVARPLRCILLFRCDRRATGLCRWLTSRSV